MPAQKGSKGEGVRNRNVAPSGRWDRWAGGGMGRSLQWDGVDTALIAEAVSATTALGDGILFGTSADGGVLVVTVYSGGQAHRKYAHGAEEAEVLLQAIVNVARAEEPL